MDNERKKRLLETMKSFNKSNKKEILSFGNEVQDKEVIPIGIKNIDDFIGGGTKRGTFTVIYGGQSVGKSTLVLQAISTAQKNGLICCYIDLEHTFDKERATVLGVNVPDLLVSLNCETAEEALEIIRKLCKEKVVDLIVVDSVQAMSPINEQENKGKERELASKEIAELARTLSKFFRVVAPDVYRAKASVIMIGQVRIAGIGSFYTHADMTGGEALKHWASTRCFLRRGQRTNAPVSKFKEVYIDPDGKVRYSTKKEEIGFDAVIKLEKTKSSDSAKENSEIHIPFVYEKGFVDEVKESEDIPIKIDAKNEEEKKKIEEYLEDKRIENARKNGNYIGKNSPDIKITEKTKVHPLLQQGYTPEKDTQKEGKIIPPKGGTGETKRKRGRPKKEKQ